MEKRTKRGKRRARRLAPLMLSACMVFTAASAAFAQTVTIDGKPLDDYRVYHDIRGWGVLSDTGMNRYSINGRVAFCVQAGGAIRGIDGDYEGGKVNHIDVDYEVSKVTEDSSAQSKMAYLGYYSLSSPSDKDYAFTQMMIWQTLPESYANGTNSETGKLRSYFTDKDLRSEYNKWKSAIQKKVDAWNDKPSFDGDALSVTAGETKTFTDSNGVLKDFGAFSTEKSGVTLTHTAGSNSMKVTVAKGCTSTKVSFSSSVISAAGGEKYPGKNTANYVYKAEKSQDLTAYGNVKPVTFSVSFNVDTIGNLALVKKSEAGLVSGISFKVEKSDGTYKTTAVTGRDGTFTLRDIPTGEYTVTEITPDGFVPQQPKKVTVKAGETASVQFSNNLIKGHISLTKKGLIPTFDGPEEEVTDDAPAAEPEPLEVLLSGAVYDVIALDDFKAADGTLLQKAGDVADTITTDKNGFAQSKELYLGRYVLKEVTAPKGFHLSEEELNVTLTSGEPQAHVEATDNAVMGRISLTKKGLIPTFTGPTEGVADEAPSDGAPAYDAPANDPEVDPAGNFAGDNGPSDSDPAADLKPLEVLLSGAVYDVIALDDFRASDGTLLQKAGDVADTITTDESGFAQSKELYLGRYVLKEVTAPKGFHLSEEELNVTLTSGEPQAHVEATDNAVMGRISLIKSGDSYDGFTDNEDGSQTPVAEKTPLEGAVYEIIAQEDFFAPDGTLLQKAGEVADVITTDENGFAVSRELYLGKYRIHEASAPYGYAISEEDSLVELTAENTEIQIEAFDDIKIGSFIALAAMEPLAFDHSINTVLPEVPEPVPEEPKEEKPEKPEAPVPDVPKTGDESGLYGALILAVLAASALAASVKVHAERDGLHIRKNH